MPQTPQEYGAYLEQAIEPLLKRTYALPAMTELERQIVTEIQSLLSQLLDGAMALKRL